MFKLRNFIGSKSKNFIFAEGLASEPVKRVEHEDHWRAS